MIGRTLGHYRILDQLGAGGMGEVYRAEDKTLQRHVALKVLPASLSADPQSLARFKREARSLATLDHPNIVSIHSVEESDGIRFLTMQLVEGEPLSTVISRGELSVERILDIAIDLTDALASAHEKGIIHRDLKPANIMLTDKGRVKVLDFGLAKSRQEAQAPVVTQMSTELMSENEQLTRQGVVLGTVPYMSPEQVQGRPVDHRTDIFSFGVVLYEMACGKRPFGGENSATLISSILRDEPESVIELRPGSPQHLVDTIRRCLEKEREQRYASARELHGELLELQHELGASQAAVERKGLTLGRRAIAGILALLVIAAGAIAWLWLRDDVVRWMERDTLARITELTEAGELGEAFQLVREVRERLPDNAEVSKMQERFTIPITIATEPPGAEVEVKQYASPDAPWIVLGETPLEGVRHPYALMQWRIGKEGYETFEGAPMGVRSLTAFAQGFALDPEGSRPEGMVRVPGGPYALEGFPTVELADYWLDRYEITNRQFKEFIDSGGYVKEEYWTEPFVEEGREISRAEAIARFVDRTGRPGPASWEVGSYAGDEADFPVGGVSWYEAAAYCGSLGKSLPTLFHWQAAVVQDQFSDIVRVSNFDDDGPAAVGSHRGLGDFGTYDMAGNVKEWCWNKAGEGRYILGGAWGEPSYLFRLNQEFQLPFSREPTHGFRCARFQDPPQEELWRPVLSSYIAGATPEVTPVDDEIFAAYRRMYAYDPASLEAAIESVDESWRHWRRETVSFKASYGGERVLAHLLLPRNAEPPYQAVIWFPGDDVFFFPAGQGLASQHFFDFIPRSGRALVYPVYKGMYERYVPISYARNEYRDMMILWSKDLGRTVDYLEERPDIDAAKLAFYGLSAGASFGPVFTAIDGRFKASILLGGGLLTDIPPEMDQVNFAPRSRVPTLMINGRDDFILNFERSQEPLFRLLGAAEDEKRLARLEGGHLPTDRVGLIEEVLGWLDRFLGPVESGYARSADG